MDHDREIREMFACLDRDGVPGLFPYLTEDVLFRFAGYPEGRGRETFATVWEQMSPKIRTLEHAIAETIRSGDTIYCHGTVTYHLFDADPICVPFANRFCLAGDLISEYHIYVDASPVFGAAPPPES